MRHAQPKYRKLRGAEHPQFGRERSPEHSAKISHAKKGTKTGADGCFYGKRHSPETRQRMSEQRKKFFANGGKSWLMGTGGQGLTAGAKNGRWKGVDDENIAYLFDVANLTIRAIGKRVGLAAPVVTRRLKRLGFDTSVRAFTVRTLHGHSVRSSLEQSVDDWLFLKGIKHVYEPAVPHSRYRADFKVGRYYIEIWGLKGRERYDKRSENKRAHYRAHNLPLIEICPNDMEKLDQILKSLFH